MKRLEITIFTDPMMGLSYESEPFLRKLETHFPDQIIIKNVMSGLVRNVYDFVDPNDLAVGKEYAIERYLPRLAAIYNAEQTISGMPIQMENLQLFSTGRTSSLPLNLAYKAVQRIDESKAAEFLYRLRFATIVEVRPTTETEELVRVAEQIGIAADSFLMAFRQPETARDLQADFDCREKLGVRGLPAYLFRYGTKERLFNGVLTDKDFLQIIDDISGGQMQPEKPELNRENLWALIEKHRLISPIELQYAFGEIDIATIQPFIDEWHLQNKVNILHAGGSYFIERNRQ